MTELERAQQKEIARLREENRLLRQKVDLLVRQLFGARSERLDPGQLELLLRDSDPGESGEGPGLGKAGAPATGVLEEEDAGEEPGATRQGRKRGLRPARLPEHLPVVEEVIEPGPVQACPEAWRKIGEEVSEQLDYEPGRFLRRRTVRPKYVRRCEREAPPIIAPLPGKLIEGGLAAPGLLTQIVISKYADHVPLYRQEQIYRQRHGVEIPRQNMERWIGAVADWLRPIYGRMRQEMFSGSYLQADETPIRYLEPGAGKTQQGYLWVYRVPGGGDTLFDWHPGRGHQCLEAMVPESFAGTLQCDGYGAYRTFAAKRGGQVELAGCWAHVRRKFYEAWRAGESKPRSGWVLRQIKLLYRIERKLRQSRAGPRLRQAIRSSQSRMIAARLQRALFRFKTSRRHKPLPQSLMGKAIDYALGQWPAITAFLEDGRIEIDNNLVENAIRPTAVGKKNWLFIGAEEAGWRGAVIYSIIESCRNHGIDPHAYLKDVLTRLPSMTNWRIKDLTPRAWAAAASTATAEVSALQRAS